MDENEISKIIFDAGLKIHRDLGLLINFNVKLFKNGYKRVLSGDVSL